jgi:hypothetical protein
MSRAPRSRPFSRLGFNIRTLVEVLAIVLIWRGIWVLLDTYFLPIHPAVSAILGIVVGIMILLIDDLVLLELRDKRHKN